MSSGLNSRSVAQSYPEELKLEGSFFVIKVEIVLNNKVIAFYQFSSNGKPLTLGAFFYLESFLSISGISGLSFFAIKHIRKPGNHGKFL